MSGWDEGAVYYSDQAQFPSGRVGDNSSDSRHSVLLKFKEFIRSFETKSNVFPYRQSLVQNPTSLIVNLEHLDSFDPDLPSLLRSAPADYLPLFETAASEVLASLKSKVAGETGEMEEPFTEDVQILLTSNEDSISIRSLGAQYISKMVKISGITIAASRTKAKATYVTLLCKNCKNVKLVPCRPGLGGAIIPRSCDHIPQPGEEPCPLDPWLVVPDRSRYVDQQTLKLQENPEDVPTGELPRNMLLSVDRHLVQTIVPGSRLTVIGIYSIFQAANASTAHKGAVAIRQPYIRVVGIEEANEASNTRGQAAFTADEIEEFKRFAAQPKTYETICSKIAPSIFGHVDVKKAVASLLFGGSRKSLPDGVKLRGDINVLLLGDPSTAKSQFLKFVEKTAPVAVYTSGKGSSAAGLTASVIRDSGSREFYLEGGAMVLADGGVVCIDEFDKMRAEDRVAIHEAMEQQTISIAKAGITTVLNSRTSVLAAANPPSGRYDDLKTAQDNIDLQTTILSRFDLIFIVKDIRMYSQDKEIAKHITNLHATAGSTREESKVSKEENWLKRYIHYCRSNCRPRLSESAAKKLQTEYVSIRQDMRQKANESGEASAIPITVRQLEAIVRLSEALAKMRLSDVATDEQITPYFLCSFSLQPNTLVFQLQFFSVGDITMADSTGTLHLPAAETNKWKIPLSVFFKDARSVFKMDSLGLEILRIAIPAALALAADPVASLIDTVFIGHIGAVELAAVGVSIAIFNQASKITIYPLVSITTSFVAEEETVSKMNAEVEDAENQKEALAEAGDSKEMMPQDDALGKLEEGTATNISKDDHLAGEDYLGVTKTTKKASISSPEKIKVVGKRHIPSASTAIVLGLFLGLCQTIFLVFGAKMLLGVMGVKHDSPMLKPALKYLTLRSFGAPAVLLSLAMQGVFRGFKDTTTPLYATVAADGANIILDAVLIFACRLGVSGAAIAHVLSQYLMSFILLWRLTREVYLLPPSLKALQLGRFLKNGLYLFTRVIAVTFCVTLAASLAARLGATPMAAFQICLQVWLASSLLADGLAVAGQAILASAFAEKDYEKATAAAARVLQMSFVLGLGLAVVVGLGLQFGDGIFTSDKRVLHLISIGVPFVAATQPINSLSFVFDGVNFGASDFAYSAYSMVLVAIASIGSLFLLYNSYGFIGIWSALTIYMGLRTFAGIWRMGTGTGPWRFLRSGSYF